jgi:hypothetical protein
MTTSSSASSDFSGSAKIYTFPPRGRFATAGQREDSARAADMQLPRGARIVSGSAWYHDEAIAAEKSRRP